MGLNSKMLPRLGLSGGRARDLRPLPSPQAPSQPAEREVRRGLPWAFLAYAQIWPIVANSLA